MLEKSNVTISAESLGEALVEASEKGHGAIIRKLLDEGADTNVICGFRNMDALATASARGDKVLARLLIERGAVVNKEVDRQVLPLEAAAKNGQQDIVRLLLEHGADVNIRNGSAIRLAARGGYEEIVQRLLENGANSNARGYYYEYYCTALEAALSGGHASMARMLLFRNANVNIYRDNERNQEKYQVLLDALIKSSIL
ncbi:ankyrin repeat domain-containing protein [Stachybotrys elegans]|uniref:Ankyrin repeat domain-containing protein n=1 Tax=Stachybotrys elegans TaxID=80388 RepID=A0A8K0SIW1_9HYPO|nr:ankyrin repeat domain-containing protein [Stachybotrys elegans]